MKNFVTRIALAIALVLSPSIGLPFAPANRAEAAVTTGQVNIQMYGATGNGTTNDRAPIAAAVASFGSAAGDLLIPPGTYLVGSSLTIPANVRIVGNGGILKSGSGATITVNGSVLTTQRQLFSFANLTAAPVTFGVGSVESVSPKWFGATGDGTTDDLNSIQAAITSCLGDARRPIPLVFPAGKFLVSDSLFVNVRASAVAANFSAFQVRGAGGGTYTDSAVGTTLYKTTSGAILKVCEEADGSYPGGGAGVVTSPLNYLRTLNLSDMNFVGAGATTDGLVGRGIVRSVIRNCGFSNLGSAIRFGKDAYITGSESQELSADSVQLDYCEQNNFDHIVVKNCEYHISIAGGDTTSIKNSYLSQCLTTAGKIFRFAAGNDFYNIESNIIHPCLADLTTPVTSATSLYFVRGLHFKNNHFEHIYGPVIGGSVSTFTEKIVFEGNAFFGDTVTSMTSRMIDIVAMRPFASVSFMDNYVIMAEPTVDLIQIVENGTAASTCTTEETRNVCKDTTGTGAVRWYVRRTLGASDTTGKVRTVTTSTGTLTNTDRVVLCNRAGTVGLTLPSSPRAGQLVDVSDISGAAALNNITITPSSGTINGAATQVLKTDYASVKLIFDGTNWFMLSKTHSQMTYGTVAPVSGTYTKGSIVWNISPDAGEPVGWSCTVAGTPGTWVAFSALDAVTLTGNQTVAGIKTLSSALVAPGFTLDSSAVNTIFGYQALNALSSGTGNTALGYQAGKLVATTTNNTFIGYTAGTAATGASNTAIGNASFKTTQGFNNCTAVGSTALGSTSQAASNCTAVGQAAGLAATSAANITFIGQGAGQAVTTGGTNTFIGAQAGNAGTAITTGTLNTFVGYSAQAAANNVTNASVIGANAISPGNNTVQLGDSACTAVSAALKSTGGTLTLNATVLRTGTGSPESVVTGSPGDIFLNTTGGAGTTLYVKQSGSATNTGWVGSYSGSITGDFTVTAGDAILASAGNGFKIKEGSNATMGLATIGGSNVVTVSTTKVTANSRIFLTIQDPSGASPPGDVWIDSRIPGTSFVIKNSTATNPTVAWMIIEPSP